jgi:hypothetical protein
MQEAYKALRRERDELAVQLAQIEAFEPGITAKARVWVVRVDRAPTPAIMPSSRS